MRRHSQKVHYTIRAIRFFILLTMISARSQWVHGQISKLGAHRPEYSTANLHNSNSKSTEDDDLSNESVTLNTHGEIVAPKSLPLSAEEPSCEELRAMWIFSKRQSRAAEMSNEIPTYRDPFTYNLWDPIYASSRGIGSRMMSRFREPSRPVFGRIVNREPVVIQRLPARPRIFDDVPRIYGSESRSAIPAFSNGLGQRRYMQYRFSGNPYNVGGSPANNLNVHQGSFQKLKEMIWTERARELTQQRKAEEMAARAAALKELAAGQNFQALPEYNSKPEINDEYLSPNKGQYFHHKTNRMPVSNSQSQGNVKSTFSGNLNTNSAHATRLLIPNMVASMRDYGATQKNHPMRASHFRERNRVLFRQSSPSDYYQRESRSNHIQSNNNINQHHYKRRTRGESFLYNSLIPYDYVVQESVRTPTQPGGLYKKMIYLGMMTDPTNYSQEKFNIDDNITTKTGRHDNNRFTIATNNYDGMDMNGSNYFYKTN